MSASPSAAGEARHGGPPPSGAAQTPDNASVQEVMAGGGGPGKSKNGKKAGKGRVWTTPERVALCEAYKQCTQDAGVGTSQQAPTLWSSIWFAFVRRTPPKLTSFEMRGRWSNRPPTSAKNEFQRNIGPCCQRFAHFYHVASTRLTGNMNEESVLRAARCLYTATSAYSAEQKDVDYEKVLKEQGKSAPVRRARLVPENWQPCWQVLRGMDKWSGASANPEMERLFIDDAEDEDESDYDTESQSAPADGGQDKGKGKGKRKREEYDGLQGRPLGRQGAKRAAHVEKKEDAFEASLNTSNKAMLSVADSMAKKAALAEAAYRLESRKVAIDFFSRPENRGTPEGIEFRSMMLKLAVDLGRASAETVLAERAESQGAGVVAPSSDSTPARTGTGSATAAGSSGPRRGERPPSRGTRSMATKVAKAQDAIDALDVDLPVTTPRTAAAGAASGTAPVPAANAGGRAEGARRGSGRSVEGDVAEDDEVDFDVVNVDASDVDGEDSVERAAIVLSGHPDDDEGDDGDGDDDEEEGDGDGVADVDEEES